MNGRGATVLTMARLHARERALVGAGTVLLPLLGWASLILPGTGAGPTMAMNPPPPDDPGLWVLALALPMWAVMMVAMMLPAASPMILAYARVHRQRKATGGAVVPTWIFVTGYLLVWMNYALLAAIAQWALYQGAVLNAPMGRIGNVAAGVVLIAAGSFQFSRVKHACLQQCRSPIGFVLTEWREGYSGALVMGLRHGAFCVGCCWALMLLMFAGGVMNLAWMAALALYFLAEKLLPGMHRVSRVTGALLIGAGAVLCIA